MKIVVKVQQENTELRLFHRLWYVYMQIRYLSKNFDCLTHPNLSATLATDQKLLLSHLRISYQSLAVSLTIVVIRGIT